MTTCMPKLLTCFAMFAGCLVADAREPTSNRLQVFILAGQSNMVGHANYITVPRLFADERAEVQALSKLVFKPGRVVTRAEVDAQIAVRIERDALQTQLRKKEIEGEQAVTAAEQKLETLRGDYDEKTRHIKASFSTSDRVYISSIADNHQRSGPLTFGFGGSADKIGPELGFGMAMAQQISSPILIIKTAWGGKSLHYNFRSPSAGPYELNEKEKASEKSAQIAAEAGLNYRKMLEKVEEVLANLQDYHPAYDTTAGYDLAGFVWFQGFNDQFADPFRDNYENNMISFINDLRRQTKTPRMPVVIGVLGTGMTAEEVGKNKVSQGQRAAAKHAAFAGNVTAVESYQVYDLSAYEVYKKGWQDHFAEWCAVGSDRPYHYLGSGKFFVRLGDAFASAMAGLIASQE